ncbi:putative nucleotidyltransferase, Ribonuclease H [Helianthus annuus]|nr:putative nucleotidyltransferase, Ribonuclease H [Helianthus annuus]
MTGVPRDIAQHCLNIKPSAQPVTQARRSFSEEKAKAMDEQVVELPNAGILREVKYHTWVANPVMVQKHNGGWRMCVDFKDLNKACPRDCYALPEIDKKVDSLASFRWKCFLDCYKGYHQVQMKEEDEDKTAFRTDKGIFCYTKMPFGLRNAGATYQRLMDTVFKDNIGKTVEVYMDDLVIMSHGEDLMLTNIQRTFDFLRSVNLKLNPTKCSFGMEEGKFLGFIVTREGFKVNPEKVQAIQQMPSPATMKEMQILAGRLAALNRFLANHAAKSYPFMSTLRNCGKKTPFQRTPEAEAAFKQMKECLIQLPTLTAPKEREPLILYLSAAEVAVGVVLMVERDNVQTPTYYISKMLTGPETRYSMIEKLVLALVHASRRLRRYFSGHVITVLTNYHLGQILSKPDVAGRLAKWAIELGGYNIFYKPRPAIKGQILADFATEVPIDKIQECEAIQNPTPVFDDRVWTLHTDGASNDDGAGAGLRLVSPDNHELTYAIRLDFQNTNNEAEYEAFLAGLRLALKMGAKNLEANVDSKLIAEQVNGHYDAKGEAMALYLEQARMLISQFQTFKVNHINRSENKHADALSKLAATSFKHLAKEVRIEVLSNPSIHLKQVNIIEVGNPSWMSPIILYLQHGKLPEEKAEARKLQHKAINYEMADGVLYRKSFMGPLLCCVDKTDAHTWSEKSMKVYAEYMRDRA